MKRREFFVLRRTSATFAWGAALACSVGGNLILAVPPNPQVLSAAAFAFMIFCVWMAGVGRRN